MIYPRAEKWVQTADWLSESNVAWISDRLQKQNIDHFWPLYFLKNLGGQGFLPYTPFGTSLNFKVLFNKTFFSEFMEFQRIIWFILICLHFVMTQKSVHIKTTYYIIWSATLAVCSAQWCKLSNFCPFGFNISHFPTKLLSPNLYNHVYKSYIL